MDLWVSVLWKQIRSAQRGKLPFYEVMREEHNWKSRINYLVNSNKERFYKISPLQLPADQTLQNGSILEIKFLNSKIVITIPPNSLRGNLKIYCLLLYLFSRNYLLHTFAEQQIKNVNGKHYSFKVRYSALFFFPDPQRMYRLGWYKGAVYTPNNELI